MKRDRFEYHCYEAEAGRDAFVAHPTTGEEGRVVSCSFESGQMAVKTPENRDRCWDYSECEDLPRPEIRPMG